MELQLHKFYEKIGEVDYLSGLVTKYKEVRPEVGRSVRRASGPWCPRRTRRACWTC